MGGRMFRWMDDGWVDEWINGWMDGQVGGTLL